MSNCSLQTMPTHYHSPPPLPPRRQLDNQCSQTLDYQYSLRLEHDYHRHKNPSDDEWVVVVDTAIVRDGMRRTKANHHLNQQHAGVLGAVQHVAEEVMGVLGETVESASQDVQDSAQSAVEGAAQTLCGVLEGAVAAWSHR